MSDNENEITTSPLHQAWLACRRAHDAATANLVLTQHGGDAGAVASVPKNRVGDCIAALQKLTGKPKNAPAKDDDATGLERVRKQAFARIGSPEAEPAKPPQSIDEKSVWAKWNRPNGKTLGDEHQ